MCLVGALMLCLSLLCKTPPWATPEWQDFAAHIVASEARGVPQADIVVACTLVRDVERGWNPWALRSRWFGWGTPDEADREAVRLAVTGHCDGVPSYVYVGNFQDAQYWRSLRMIGDEAPVDLYLGSGGAAVVGVPWPASSSGAGGRTRQYCESKESY